MKFQLILVCLHAMIFWAGSNKSEDGISVGSDLVNLDPENVLISAAHLSRLSEAEGAREMIWLVHRACAAIGSNCGMVGNDLQQGDSCSRCQSEAKSIYQRLRDHYAEQASPASDCAELHPCTNNIQDGTAFWLTSLKFVGTHIRRPCVYCKGDEELFTAPITADMHGIMAARFPRGRCLFTTARCSRYPVYSGVIVDESEEAYSALNVGEDAASCLNRAQINWEKCGSFPAHPVAMLYLGSGRIAPQWASFPPDAEVAAFVDAAQSPLSGQGDPASGGWKTIHAWVEGSSHGGLPPVPAPGLRLDHLMRALRDGMTREEAARGVIEVEQVRALLGGLLERMETEHGAAVRPGVWNGQFMQDELVAAVLNGQRGGFFLDLAAFDAVSLSNSLALERDYGWRGICIEVASELSCFRAVLYALRFFAASLCSRMQLPA